MRTVVNSALLAIGFVALWFLDDAFTFALYARSAARASGCYTTIENWVGVTRPSQIRTAEASFGLGLLVMVIVWPALQGFRRMRARRTTRLAHEE